MVRVVRDENTVAGLMVENSSTSAVLPVTGADLTNSQPVHVAIVDGSGDQITNFDSDSPDIDITTHTNYQKKYYTSAGAATDGVIWSPASGKRWHVVTLYINVSAASTITLEDDKAGGDEAVWKGEFAANSGVVISFGYKYPLASGEDAADLTITTTAGNVYVLAVGYEI